MKLEQNTGVSFKTQERIESGWECCQPKIIYTPGVNDITLGNVDLILLAFAVSPCSDNDQDTITLVFDPLPVAYAGVDDTICINQTGLISS